MDPDQTASTLRSSLMFIFTVCRRGFKNRRRPNQTSFFVIDALRVNNCEFSVNTITLFMKCSHVCVAQTTYFKTLY